MSYVTNVQKKGVFMEKTWLSFGELKEGDIFETADGKLYKKKGDVGQSGELIDNMWDDDRLIPQPFTPKTEVKLVSKAKI